MDAVGLILRFSAVAVVNRGEITNATIRVGFHNVLPCYSIAHTHAVNLAQKAMIDVSGCKD